MICQRGEGFEFLVFYFVELVHAPDLNGCVIGATDESIAGFRHQDNLIDPVSMMIQISNQLDFLTRVVNLPQLYQSIATRRKNIALIW